MPTMSFKEGRMNYLKTQPIRSNKLRRAARGQPCTVELPCCDGGGETTVLAHLPDESGGMGRKSDDLSGVHCCNACHDVIDRRETNTFSALQFADNCDFYLRRAQTRTLRRLYELGVIRVAA